MEAFILSDRFRKILNFQPAYIYCINSYLGTWKYLLFDYNKIPISLDYRHAKRRGVGYSPMMKIKKTIPIHLCPICLLGIILLGIVTIIGTNGCGRTNHLSPTILAVFHLQLSADTIQEFIALNL
jgi:hypothetical protein